jgi:hypothetical protein
MSVIGGSEVYTVFYLTAEKSFEEYMENAGEVRHNQASLGRLCGKDGTVFSTAFLKISLLGFDLIY